MTIQTINLGTGPDTHDGDAGRTALDKVNDNFSELDTRVADLEAGSLADGISISKTNPNVTGNANEPKLVSLSATFNYTGWDGTNMNPGFTNREIVRITLTGTDGQNHNGGSPSTSAKTSWIPLLINGTYKACGQRFAMAMGVDNQGMGDAFCLQMRNDFYSGPINGDEGAGFTAVNYLRQATNNGSTRLERGTISSVPAQATIDTTLTQAVVADDDPQTVTVASTSGLSVGQWVSVGQEVADGAPNLEAVLVTALTGNSITGTFLLPHNSGQAVKAAKVLVMTNTNGFGQQRVLVNLTTTATYLTGTAGVTGGGNTVVGTGTTFANNMVGGDAANVGAIALELDDYSGSPFNSTGENSTLKSWYQIKTVTDGTHLTIHSFDVAGDTSYQGLQTSAGNYIVRPAMRILRIIEATNTIICEWSAHTWSPGDSVEVAVCPYPDITGFSFHIAAFTPGGKRRAYMLFDNTGARKFDNGIWIRGDSMKTGGNADTQCTGIGVRIEDSGTGFFAQNCDYGFDVNGVIKAAIRLGNGQGNAITWNNVDGDFNANAYIRAEDADDGLTFRMVSDASSSTTVGALRCVAAGVNGKGAGNHSLTWGGVLAATSWINLPSYTVAGVPSASTAGAGAAIYVSNETGGGTIAFSDGTNWRRVQDRAVIS